MLEFLVCIYRRLMPACIYTKCRLYNIDWKEWRQSYKTLILLEFLLTHGPEDFAEEFQGDSEVIQELGSFKYIDDRG